MPRTRNRNRKRGGGGNPPKRKNRAKRRAAMSAQTIGRGIGGFVGGHLGNLVGKGISRIFGRGDYDVAAEPVTVNTLAKGSMATQAPQFSGSDGTIRVCHREYLGTIDVTDPFAFYRLRIDPTDPITFPWLSPIARTFQQWKPLGVVFEFMPTCGTAISSTNPAMGVVASKTAYNVDSLSPTGMSDVLNSHFATSGAPYQTQMTAVECAEASQPFRWWKIRSDLNGTPENALYEFATQYYAVQGAQTTYTAGQLWISYDILLTMPKVDNGVNLQAPMQLRLGDHSAAAQAVAQDDESRSEAHTYVEPRMDNYVRVENRSVVRRPSF